MSPVGKPSESGIRRAVTAPPVAAAPPPVAETGLDAAVTADWRWRLGAKSRKLAAARAKADAAAADWARLVADARSAGVAGRVIEAAAADAGIEPPGQV